MIKKIVTILGMLALAAGTSLSAATNVVTLDMNRVIETFHKTAQIKADIEADGKFADETQKIKVDEFNKLKEELEAAAKAAEEAENNPTLSAKAKTEAKTKFQTLYKKAVETEKNLRQTQTQTREFLNNKFTQKTNVVLQEDILPCLKEVAKTHDAQIVLNARTGILFADKSVDITDELLALLEKKFPTPADFKKPETTTAAPATTSAAK